MCMHLTDLNHVKMTFYAARDNIHYLVLSIR